MYRNGVMFLQLKNSETCEAVTSALDAQIPKNLRKSSSSKKPTNLSSRREGLGKLLCQVVDGLRDKEALLLLDNLDLLLSYPAERNRLQNLLDYLFTNCPAIKVLSTSRTPLGGVPLAGCVEKLYTLGRLSPEDSKALFLLRAARPIPANEIAELLQCCPPPQIGSNSLMSSRDSLLQSSIFPPPSTPSSSLSLSSHSLLDLLGGHPQTITLAAALLSDRTLKELYL
jgi:hypothetical protein